MTRSGYFLAPNLVTLRPAGAARCTGTAAGTGCVILAGKIAALLHHSLAESFAGFRSDLLDLIFTCLAKA